MAGQGESKAVIVDDSLLERKEGVEGDPSYEWTWAFTFDFSRMEQSVNVAVTLANYPLLHFKPRYLVMK